MNYTIPIFNFWIGFVLLSAFSAAVAVIIDRRLNREREADRIARELAENVPTFLREMAD